MAAQAPEAGRTDTVWPGAFVPDSLVCPATTADLLGSWSLGRCELAEQAEDLAEEATIEGQAVLDSFRDKSRFRIWSQKIAARVALTALRCKRWNDVPLERFLISADDYTVFRASRRAVAATR